MKHLFLTLTALIWASLFAATSVAAQDNYRLQPGDTVSIEVLEDQSLNRSLLVLPDGTINFPFAGTIRAGGRTVNQLETTITDNIATNFASRPTVFVTVSAVQPDLEESPFQEGDLMNVYFAGEIRNVGLQRIETGTTLLQALALAGGFTEFAAIKRIQLRRNSAGGGQVIILNFRALADGASLINNPMLRDGDVILVPERRLFE